jgi:hypothetical protein
MTLSYYQPSIHQHQLFASNTLFIMIERLSMHHPIRPNRVPKTPSLYGHKIPNTSTTP